jgi:hypothetical protein
LANSTPAATAETSGNTRNKALQIRRARLRIALTQVKPTGPRAGAAYVQGIRAAISAAPRPEPPARSTDIEESNMKRTTLTLGAIALAIATTLAVAQPGGPGYGPGAGCGNGPGAGGGQAAADGTCPMGPGRGMGMGPGAGHGMGSGARGHGGAGAALLTTEERTAFRDQMHATTTVEACKATMAAHRAVIEQRAKEQGVTLPAGPRGDPCERMKARGRLS